MSEPTEITDEQKIKSIGDRLGRYLETYGKDSLFMLEIARKESLSPAAWHAIHYGQFMYHVNRQLGREIMTDLGRIPK